MDELHREVGHFKEPMWVMIIYLSVFMALDFLIVFSAIANPGYFPWLWFVSLMMTLVVFIVYIFKYTVTQRKRIQEFLTRKN